MLLFCSGGYFTSDYSARRCDHLCVSGLHNFVWLVAEHIKTPKMEKNIWTCSSEMQLKQIVFVIY